MLTKSALSGLFLLFTLSAHALETDNYIVWDKELRDSSADINGHIEEKIEEALERMNNKRKTQSCEAVTFAIAKKFKTTPPFHPLEDWIKYHLADDQIYPRKKKYIKNSIYRTPYRFYLRFAPLAPNVNINGFYLGTDKISHFVSTGRRYFSHYLKKIKNGYSEEEAEQSAIRFGLKNEATILGSWSSGVFSYGDMEANYQGFLFWKRMCSNAENNYLSQDEDGNWALETAPDLKDYVSAYWDETFNHSYRKPRNWESVSYYIKTMYCPLKDSPIVAARMEYYDNAEHDSYSLQYIKKLQEEEEYYRAPVPATSQSVEKLCEAPEELAYN